MDEIQTFHTKCLRRYLLIGCIAYTVNNYDQLSEAEGWGMVGMFGLFGLGVILPVTDIFLQNIIRQRTAANLAGLVIAIANTFLLIYDGFFS